MFEKRAYDLFLQNLVKGTSHLGARPGGDRRRLRRRDAPRRLHVLHVPRPRPHARARRVDDRGCMAELLGRANGLMGGKGGSMHLTERRARRDGLVRDHRRAPADRRRRGLVGAVPRTGQVAVCFFGDGTTNIGAFHEALNLAAVWKLPVVFVCENNLYMEYTPIADVTAVAHPAADRARAYGLEPIVIDGNDADVVLRGRDDGVRARAGGRRARR